MTASAIPARQSSVVVGGDVGIPLVMVTDPRLTAAEVRCWAWLASRPLGEDDEPPSRREIAEALHVSMTQATRWLVALERTGWITRHERWAAPWGLKVHREPVAR